MKRKAYDKKWYDAHPLARTWYMMKQRCLNPKYPQYCDYGGRGICICPEWIADRPRFEKDILDNLGPRPSKLHTLDRIDNNKHYELINVKWSTRKEQSNNRRARSCFKKGT